VLVSQSVLILDILQKIAAQLNNQDWSVRQAAVHALAGQSALIPEILQKVLARLEDEDSNTRQAAAKVIISQSAPTPEILQEVVTRLEHPDKGVRWAAVQVFVELAPSLENVGSYLGPFYSALLEESFKQPVAWFNVDGSSYVMVGEKKVSLGRPPYQFMEVIQATQRALGFPLSK
jgi:hypothetical protein